MHPARASFTRSDYGLDLRITLAAGKQPFTLTDAMHPALTDSFTGAAHVMSCANKVLEGVLKKGTLPFCLAIRNSKRVASPLILHSNRFA